MKGSDGSDPIGDALRVGDGEGLDARVAQGVLGERLKRGIGACPEDEDTARDREWDRANRPSRGRRSVRD